MKIGFLVGAHSYGGGERFLNMLMEEFHQQGHSVSVFSWDKGWQAVDVPYTKNIMENPPLRILGKFKGYSALLAAMKADRPDVMICFNHALSEVGLPAAKVLRVPYLTSERCDPRFIAPPSAVHRLLKKWILRNSEGVVFQTETICGLHSKKIRKHGRVIANPVLDNDLPQCDCSQIRKEVVSVGRLSDEKDFGTLIEAFAEVAPADYKLVIYGDGPQRSQLEAKINELGVTDRVVLYGKVDRVIDYIKQSDVFVLTSKHEGMPNALIEAMAVGLACIATDVPSHSVRALIHDGENGFIVPVGDKEALKTRLKELIEDREVNAMVRDNALKIKETNSKEVIIGEWIKLINSVCHV